MRSNSRAKNCLTIIYLISTPLTRQLRSLKKQRRSSSSITILAVWQSLLKVYQMPTGKRETVIQFLHSVAWWVSIGSSIKRRRRRWLKSFSKPSLLQVSIQRRWRSLRRKKISESSKLHPSQAPYCKGDLISEKWWVGCWSRIETSAKCQWINGKGGQKEN